MICFSKEVVSAVVPGGIAPVSSPPMRNTGSLTGKRVILHSSHTHVHHRRAPGLLGREGPGLGPRPQASKAARAYCTAAAPALRLGCSSEDHAERFDSFGTTNGSSCEPPTSATPGSESSIQHSSMPAREGIFRITRRPMCCGVFMSYQTFMPRFRVPWSIKSQRYPRFGEGGERWTTCAT